ncbi:DUF6907 domain-containing protein [Streptomyces sp. NPDC059698]|uniref:DUF6907 domain-containing protein n=1 Tax=unclassified Streptomyces TaxID=2593676 RepID=UPI00093EE761|nr:hypothetical protein [Streptomyces sp. CB02366]OKJ38255.1 hypothetical protein AMK24_11425 [Streptomyces sp. CB02366]
MSAPRTVTVQTSDLGAVTVPEPTWCAGHAEQPVEALVDLGHRGTEHALGRPGDPVGIAFVSQHPHGNGPREIGLFVEQTALAITLGPDAARGLADDYETAAAQLRRLADWLHILQAGERR